MLLKFDDDLVMQAAAHVGPVDVGDLIQMLGVCGDVDRATGGIADQLPVGVGPNRLRCGHIPMIRRIDDAGVATDVHVSVVALRWQ